jgi:hypothetical protein
MPFRRGGGDSGGGGDTKPDTAAASHTYAADHRLLCAILSQTARVSSSSFHYQSRR